MTYKIEVHIDPTNRFFIDVLKEVKTEDFVFSSDKIVIIDNQISKLRAKTNFVLRLLNIYEKFKEFLKDNEVNG